MVNKEGKVIWELTNIIIAILILVTMAAVILILYKGGGGKVLDAVKNVLRFGR